MAPYAYVETKKPLRMSLVAALVCGNKAGNMLNGSICATQTSESYIKVAFFASSPAVGKKVEKKWKKANTGKFAGFAGLLCLFCLSDER